MRHLLALSLLVLSQYAPGRQGLDPLSKEKEARVMTLGKQIRCPVCQGLSIADSQSSMARAQIDKLRELVTEGKTDVEIRDYFVARYGEWALLEPTKTKSNLILWLGPFAVLAIGGFIVFSRQKKVPTKIESGPPVADASSAHLIDEVRRDVEQS